MKTKVMIPALAFVFAIGMSFATEKSTADAANDWVDIPGQTERMKIQEVNCGIPATVCEGQFEVNGLFYEIYDSETSPEPKQGAGELEQLLIPVEPI